MKKVLFAVLLLVGSTAPAGDRSPHPAADLPVPPAAKQRGVSWVAAGPVTREDLLPLVRVHVEWIAQTPFGWQRGLDAPEIRLATSHVLWGETDEGIEATTRMAKEAGIRTLLKPHVWVTGAGRSIGGARSAGGGSRLDRTLGDSPASPRGRWQARCVRPDPGSTHPLTHPAPVGAPRSQGTISPFSVRWAICGIIKRSHERTRPAPAPCERP